MKALYRHWFDITMSFLGVILSDGALLCACEVQSIVLATDWVVENYFGSPFVHNLTTSCWLVLFFKVNFYDQGQLMRLNSTH